MKTFDTAIWTAVGEREVNEDACEVLEQGGVTCWAVADGLGGHRGGEIASRAAVEAVIASFRESAEVSAASLARHVAAAHRAIRDRQAEDTRLASMRSTLVVLLSDGRGALWAHVGDSRLYHLRDGRVVARTRDHSVSQALVDAGEVAAGEQGRHEDRSRLLRCLGQDVDPQPTLADSVVPLRPGDALLLCTDGFWECLRDVEIEIDRAASEGSEAWLARLAARGQRADRAGADNATAIGISYGADPLPLSLTRMANPR